jgi:hypothetical protein
MAMTEVWEEGYAAKDISKRSAEQLERKEDLEKRRKKLQQTKRQQQAQAKKGQINAGGMAGALADSAQLDVDDGEYDLDMIAEADAIRSHLEQLKR